jgi:hypothetical protein
MDGLMNELMMREEEGVLVPFYTVYQADPVVFFCTFRSVLGL